MGISPFPLSPFPFPPLRLCVSAVNSKLHSSKLRELYGCTSGLGAGLLLRNAACLLVSFSLVWPSNILD